MNIEFDVTLQCNFSCRNCNRFSNFNDLSSPHTGGKKNQVGLDFYENTDVSIEHTKKFIEDVKEHGNIDRIHLIGGEPLVHPNMDEICDLVREELWGKHVKEILIISNLHPKMLKKGVLDSPLEMIKYAPDWELDVDYEHAMVQTTIPVTMIRWGLSQDGITRDNIIDYLDKIELDPTQLHSDAWELYNLQPTANGKINLFTAIPHAATFHGIPVINYKPLSKKHEEHRCTLVAPYDSGQELIEKCNFPRKCGINYSFDGYWPCSAAASISRLFGLEEKYKMDKLPKFESDWDGIDEDGLAEIKSEGMWDVCKLCQVAAKVPMNEKDHGRPISVSYRKAMGLESDKENVSEWVVDGHKKKLAKNIERIDRKE